MTKQVHWLCSANYRLCLSLFWLEPKSFWFLPAFLVRWGPEPQQADGAMSQLFCLRGHERGYSKQFSVSPVGSLFGRDQELPSALCMNHPPAWYRTEPSTPGTGFMLGVICSAHQLLHSSIAGLHSFQVFLPAILVTWGLETLSTLDKAVTQLLAWAFANKALRLEKLLIWYLNQADLYSVVRVLHQPDSIDEQSCWVALLLGHYKYELDLPRCMCCLLQAHPQFFFTVRFSVVEPHRFPCSLHGTRS